MTSGSPARTQLTLGGGTPCATQLSEASVPSSQVTRSGQPTLSSAGASAEARVLRGQRETWGFRLTRLIPSLSSSSPLTAPILRPPGKVPPKVTPHAAGHVRHPSNQIQGGRTHSPHILARGFSSSDSHSTVSVTSLTASPWTLAAVQR